MGFDPELLHERANAVLEARATGEIELLPIVRFDCGNVRHGNAFGEQIGAAAAGILQRQSVTYVKHRKQSVSPAVFEVEFELFNIRGRP